MLDEFLTLKRTALVVLKTTDIQWMYELGRDETIIYPVGSCECSRCHETVRMNQDTLIYHSNKYGALCSKCIPMSQHKHGIVEPLMAWIPRRVDAKEIALLTK